MAKGKVLVIGDIHGKSIYRDIIEKESPDQVIFLGDFASSHHNISPEKQIEEFDWVINYKQQHPNTIILRGNHDIRPQDIDTIKSVYDETIKGEVFV